MNTLQNLLSFSKFIQFEAIPQQEIVDSKYLQHIFCVNFF